MMIKINSVTIPTPSTFQASIMNINKAFRSAKGKLRNEIIATKRKLEITYSYLSQADLSTLLVAISGADFTVEYPDPQTGAARTGTFYSGDRSAGVIDFKSDTPRWKDIKFSLVEV